MAAFLQHCPFLKSVPKSAFRRTGASFLSLADRCPIIARQISVSCPVSLNVKQSTQVRLKPNQPHPVDLRRLVAQTAVQVNMSVSKGCPFVTDQIGMVKASPEVQEDIQRGMNSKFNRHKWTHIKGMMKSRAKCPTLTDLPSSSKDWWWKIWSSQHQPALSPTSSRITWVYFTVKLTWKQFMLTI